VFTVFDPVYQSTTRSCACAVASASGLVSTLERHRDGFPDEGGLHLPWRLVLPAWGGGVRVEAPLQIPILLYDGVCLLLLEEELPGRCCNSTGMKPSLTNR